MSQTTLTNQPWSVAWEAVLRELHVSPERGLDGAEVKKRRKRHGPNRLREAKKKSAWRILAEQFKNLIVALLAIAAVLSFVFGETVDALAIAAVIAINGIIGFVTELRAVRSMEALYRLSRVTAKVRRDQHVQEIPAQEMVPGDIVILEAGDLVAADCRLIKASKLQADESALTGESVPVGKHVDTIEGEASLAERTNMLYKGTAVTRGSGEGVVAATGMATELGRISALVEEAAEERTPLEKRLDQLGYRLIWVTLAIATLVGVSGALVGKDVFLMVQTAIALAVATIPEGLPIVATIALARGMWRMARRNALVNRLSAVETLGATNVICTDKTGTLTENRMTVTRVVVASGGIEVRANGGKSPSAFVANGRPIDPREAKALRMALEVGVLCNNAELQKRETEDRNVGDPLEIALLVAGAKGGFDREQLLKDRPEVREEAFDPEIKMMATIHQENGHYRVAVKGAPEAVLAHCIAIQTESESRPLADEDREEWSEHSNRLAADGLRVLALATKASDDAEADPYAGLTWLGVAGLLDPPRRDVREALRACQGAGIRVIMVTGDQPITARNIAMAVGLTRDAQVDVILGESLKSPDELPEGDRQRLLRAPIFARVSPKQKLDLIALHQKNGAVVAMTGDGVNDAPALKKAGIGIAMGQRGTQVAREAADMVLQDDAFSTIVAAVEDGRVIFDNIRKFVLYLLSCNVSEIMVVGLASVVNAPLPILPLQILFLNLVTDVFPALALGVGEGDPGIMQRPSRDPGEPILTRQHWLAIGGYGFVITLSVLGAFALAFIWLDADEAHAVSVAFLTLAFAQLFHVFNMRDPGSRILRNDITRNPFVWGALALCTTLLLAAAYVPTLSTVLRVVDPGAYGWLLVLAMSVLPALVGQVQKSIRGRVHEGKR